MTSSPNEAAHLNSAVLTGETLSGPLGWGRRSNRFGRRVDRTGQSLDWTRRLTGWLR
jgi:hypothetical protein